MSKFFPFAAIIRIDGWMSSWFFKFLNILFSFFFLLRGGLGVRGSRLGERENGNVSSVGFGDGLR